MEKMKKFQVDPNNDITKEPYKGPGPVLASAGYMYISHFASIVAGFLSFGGVGMVFSNRTNALKDWAHRVGDSNVEHSGTAAKGFARFVAFVSEKAEGAAQKLAGGMRKITGNRFQGKTVGEEKAAAFLFAAGLGAFTGYAASTVWGIAKGHHEGNKGKRQFERAKAEINDLRERNDDLEKINDKLHEEIVEESTKWKSEVENVSPEKSTGEPQVSAVNAVQHAGTIQPTAELALAPTPGA